MKGLYLLYNNAPALKSKVVTEFLLKESVVVLPDPLYSPDISPYDFFLFPNLK